VRYFHNFSFLERYYFFDLISGFVSTIDIDGRQGTSGVKLELLSVKLLKKLGG